ncbi:hypothetical protein EUX98_g7968 [Antrodiella citrinella]|uniref:Uncharacterized protein n=1 Tax=Antrodiella citrinella TaxID=2447956 RepID=A0A4S4ME92_9APHY|nr:hypothetical protein EUX98_g7968 [Antrodiella citrinella]
MVNFTNPRGIAARELVNTQMLMPSSCDISNFALRIALTTSGFNFPSRPFSDIGFCNGTGANVCCETGPTA